MSAEAVRQLSSVALLMKDLQPEKPMEKPKEMSKDELAQVNAIDRYNLQPVADVLIIERHTCKACKKAWDMTNGKIHRLFSSCHGEPLKRVLSPKKDDAPFLDLRVTHLIELEVPYCNSCWIDTGNWSDALALQPEKPVPSPLQVALLQALAPKPKPSRSKYAEFAKKSSLEQLKEL